MYCKWNSGRCTWDLATPAGAGGDVEDCDTGVCWPLLKDREALLLLQELKVLYSTSIQAESGMPKAGVC